MFKKPSRKRSKFGIYVTLGLIFPLLPVTSDSFVLYFSYYCNISPSIVILVLHYHNWIPFNSVFLFRQNYYEG